MIQLQILSRPLQTKEYQEPSGLGEDVMAEASLGASAEGQGPVATSSEIGAQLEQVLASPDFNVPERARTFLKYVVTETLSGRADRIKAYSVAVEVFGRDPSFRSAV